MYNIFIFIINDLQVINNLELVKEINDLGAIRFYETRTSIFYGYVKWKIKIHWYYTDKY